MRIPEKANADDTANANGSLAIRGALFVLPARGTMPLTPMGASTKYFRNCEPIPASEQRPGSRSYLFESNEFRTRGATRRSPPFCQFSSNLLLVLHVEFLT